MTTPPIYMTGDDEYDEDTREWETSTPTTLESPEYWTKTIQCDNMSGGRDTIKLDKDDMDTASLCETITPACESQYLMIT